ncbi:MAG TPA: hypothetical protein PKI37_02995 [Candidatus Cloacimonas sp.]|nr:hypothetical protein [Candidatus Cloacimonas sp.]
MKMWYDSSCHPVLAKEYQLLVIIAEIYFDNNLIQRQNDIRQGIMTV